MIRGTTAQFKINIPYRVEEVKKVVVKFWQEGYTGTLEDPLPITKTLIDPTPYDEKSPYDLVITLKPGETKRFSDKLKAYMQFWAELDNDDSTKFGSKPQIITVYPMHEGIFDEIPDYEETDTSGFIILDGKEINA